MPRVGSFLTRFAIGEALSTSVSSGVVVVHPSSDTDGSGVSVSINSISTVPVDGTVGDNQSMSSPTVAFGIDNPATTRFNASNF